MRPVSWAMLLGLAACAPTSDRPEPVWQPSGAGFFRLPWPLDTRRHADGRVDLGDFPSPMTNPGILEVYLSFAERMEGFSTNAPIYVAFDGRLDPLALPTPAESLAPGSALVLVDVDPRSAHWGERVPVQWAINEQRTPWWPEHTLAVWPMHGFPLRPETRYALLVTTDVAAPSAAFAEVWDASSPFGRTFAGLDDVLLLQGLSRDAIAVATVFTTADPVAELATLARYVREHVAPPDLARTVEHVATHDHFTAWRTHYPSPVFTHGERPYLAEGGGFRYHDDGTPIVAGFDDMRLAVCTPRDLDDPPPTGWPVVVYQHGTYADYRSFCDSDRTLEVGNRLGQVGLVGLGIDQPLHGTRNDGKPGSDLANFNVVNPESGISNFRQGALDAIYLMRALASRPWQLRTPDGEPIPLDPDRVMFMGHSQGGNTGALAAPFFGGDSQATLLSGAGGVLSITIVLRDDVLDFAELVHGAFELAADEEVTTWHPVVGLIQMVAEPTDPINYAPFWFAEEGRWSGHTPTPVLATSGTRDRATPYSTAVALAAAARLPLLHPAASGVEALDVRGIRPEEGPLRDNGRAFDGTPVTAALSQWVGGSHWVVFEEPAASDMAVEYLRSTADGSPLVVRDDAP